MINYHPDQHLLTLHSRGQLPLSMSIAISAHAEMCKFCQQKLNALTTEESKNVFEASSNDLIDIDEPNFDMASMLEDLLDNKLDMLDLMPITIAQPVSTSITIKGKTFTLPRALRKQVDGQWQGIGKVSRLRLNTGEGKARASLLHIDALGEIPEHSHKGSELTLLLAGEFSDEFNSYKPGDFMLLDENHQHSPNTTDGCLCYTIVDAPLYFTKGFTKLLNPIGELLY